MGQKTRMKTHKSFQRAEPYLYVLPYFLIFTFFLIVPGIVGMITSLFNWELVGARDFIGFGNYKELFNDRLFFKSVRNTALYSIMYVPFMISIGLLIALLFNQNYKLRNFFRVIIFSPYVFMIPAVGIMWRWLMDTNFGMLNFYLSLFGIPKVSWLTSPKFSLISIVIVILWETIGYSMILYLAALQTIPKELFEAADIDGASKWKRFWKLTAPLLQPTTFFLLVIAFIGAFKTFGQPYVMTAGGPVDSSLTIVMYLFNTGFQYFRLGYSATISTVLFFGILLFTLLQFKFIRQRFD